MRTRALCISLLALAACNPDLKNEKKTFDRYYEQLVVWAHQQRVCESQEQEDEAWKAHMKADADCKPFSDAVIHTDPSTEQAKWQAAFEAERNAPPCKEASRLYNVWKRANDKANECNKPAKEELDLRKAEVLAACQKCGLKERCEKNLQSNAELADARDFLKNGPPTEPERLEGYKEQLAEAKEKAKQPFVFACDK